MTTVETRQRVPCSAVSVATDRANIVTDRANGGPELELDSAPPPHVRTAFGVRDAPVEPIVFGALPAFRCGEAVIRPVTDNALAAWSARVLETLRADQLRIAQPLRSSDGRWVVSGWSACQFLPGEPEQRYDELVAVSLRLHAATATVRRPRLLNDRDDLSARADAAAWGERAIALDPAAGGMLFSELADRRRPLKLPAQVVHGDMFGTVLFDGNAPPAIVDIVPFWRPVEWAAAVIVVDALAWGGADSALARSWSHLDGWPQALLRALLFRVALHAQHPAASLASLRGLEQAAELVLARL